MTDVNNVLGNQDYQYGFHDDVKPLYSTGRGLTEATVRKISAEKHEPQWMLDYRLESFHTYQKMAMPKFGPDLSGLDLENMLYYQKMTDKKYRDWKDVPEELKRTFDRLGVPEAERKYLAGSAAQYESEVVYHNMKQQFAKQGIIFTDTDTALQKYPDLFKKWFGKLVKPADNKFAALNGAVWSGGSFIYVPKGVKVKTPIQAYFRLNAENTGQFERTLIIVDEGASVDYVEGCTAPNYSSDSLHAAVVEVNVLKNAYCRYTTIQNWSKNVYSLETKRAAAAENATMEWVDGNIGSAVTMKYPTCILAGEGAKGTCITIAVADSHQILDSGAKMIHLAPNTSSQIISKSISRNGGKVNYRGLVRHQKNATNAKSKVECDTLILDDKSTSDTVPTNMMMNNESIIEHEATVSKVSEDQLFYLMSRGLTKEQATEMIVMGFIEPFSRELPMEYAVELNQLIKLDMGENSIG